MHACAAKNTDIGSTCMPALVLQVVAALLKHNAPSGVAVALLPLGTANDFAAATGISTVRGAAPWGEGAHPYGCMCWLSWFLVLSMH